MIRPLSMLLLCMTSLGCGAAWSTLSTPNPGTPFSPFVHYLNDVAGTNPCNSTNVVLTVSSTGAGHLLVVGVDWFSTGTAPIITDNKGNTWHFLGSAIEDSGLDWAGVFYTNNAAAGVTTVTVNPNGNSCIDASFSEFSGANIANPTDGVLNIHTVSTLNADTGPLTPTHSDDLFFCYVYDDNSGVVGAPSNGFILLPDHIASGTPSYLISQNASPQDCRVTYGIADDDLAILVGFTHP